MTRLTARHRCLLWALPLAGAGPACAGVETMLMQPPVTLTSTLWAVPGLQLLYTLAPRADGKVGPASLRGVVEAGGSRLRTDLRLDPNAATHHVAAMDLSWELPATGPLRNLVVGDSYAAGAGWSEPARITGVRFGRALAVRAPLRVEAPTPTVSRAFAGAAGGFGEAGDSPLVDARRLLPGPGAAPAPVPAAADPTPLQGGATEYDVELGRLRDGWDSPQRTYVGQYGAAGYRAGLGHGLTAEARTEWTATQNARGLELLQQLGAGVSVQAVMARSSAADRTGQRWGMAVVRQGEGMAWRLAYAAADRDYRLVTGAVPAREGVRVGTSIALGRKATAEVSYLRTSTWDAMPSSNVVFAAQMDLPRQARVSLDIAVGATGQAARRAGVTFSLPLDTQRRP